LTRFVAFFQALLRRAQAHEKIGDLEHLELALAGASALWKSASQTPSVSHRCPGVCAADLRRVLEIEPSNRAAAKKLTELESAAEAKREQLKREMLGASKLGALASQLYLEKGSPLGLHPCNAHAAQTR